MKIIDVRDQLPTSPRKRSINDIDTVVIHHGATKRGLPGTNYLAYLKYHLNNLKWTTGGYTFGINEDGSILQGYDLTVKTNHVGKYNRTCLGIVLAGDFRYEKPTEAQWKSLFWLLQEYLPKVLPNEFKIKGHQEIPGYSWKPCPSLDMDEIRRKVVVNVLKRGDRSPDVKTLQENLNELGHNAGIPDGIFGIQTETALKSFQRATNITVDGIAGPQTLGKLEAVLKASKKVTAPKKESVTFSLGGKKYKIEEI